MEEVTIAMWWPRKNPDTVRICKINDLRQDIFRHIDGFAHAIDDLLEYGLQPEADCIKNTIIKDLWKHEEMLNELLRNANPDIKEAQDLGRWESGEKNENASQPEQPSTITCPECWWEGDKVDTCPDCEHDFTSDKEQDA